MDLEKSLKGESNEGDKIMLVLNINKTIHWKSSSFAKTWGLANTTPAKKEDLWGPGTKIKVCEYQIGVLNDWLS